MNFGVSVDFWNTFFSKPLTYTETEIKMSKTMNNEQCSLRYIVDLNRGNVKVKITIKEKTPKVNLRIKIAP